MKSIPTLTLFFFFFFVSCFAESPFRVMFYNTENLFDTLNNPDKDDDDFTPEGNHHWNNYRYYTKINNLAKVISCLGEWNIPALVGLCEIENEKVLKDLTRYSPISKMEYRYVLTNSEDARGINVALLYQRDRFKYINHQEIQLSFPHNPQKKTRNLLHVTGMLTTRDTLDVFICHYPSRRGGQINTEPDRICASEALKKTIDSLFAVRKHPQILIMGDFNDEPKDKSLYDILEAKEISDETEENRLYNLFFSISEENEQGSYKYQGEWNFLDQIIVSGNLLDQNNPCRIVPRSATIYQPSFLFTEDKTQGGIRPLKTFHGYKYEGGYSDHFPVFVDIEIIKTVF